MNILEKILNVEKSILLTYVQTRSVMMCANGNSSSNFDGVD